MSTQIEQLKTSEIVDRYNELVPADKRVKKFSDRATAIKRLKSVLPKESAPTEGKKAKAERKRRGPRFVFQPTDDIRPPSDDCARRKAWDLLARPQGATQAEIGKAVKTKKYPDGLPERQSYECIRLIHYIHGAGLRQDDNGRIYLVLPKSAAKAH